MNFATYLLETIERYGDANAIYTDDDTITYSRLGRGIRSVARGLQNAGVEGERVGVCTASSLEFVTAYHGTLLSGNTVVPLNPAYRSELMHHLGDSGAGAVITTDDLVDHVRASVPADLDDRRILRPSDLADDGSGAAPADVPDPDAAVLPYTSGTTGDPKGAIVRHDHLHSLTRTIQSNFQTYDVESSVLAALPLFHAYGMTMCLNVPLLTGTEIHLVSEWHPDEVRRHIRRERIEIFPGVPTMYRDLVDLDDLIATDLSSLRLCISRGSTMPRDLLTEYSDRFGIVILEGYGMTETTRSPIHNLRDRYRFGSVGVELTPGTTRIVDDENRPVPPGTVGQLQLHPSVTIAAYHEKPEATAEAFTTDGWFETEDLMRRDEDGFFYYVGRSDDLIVTGGHNVNPREVEAVIDDLESVHASAVVGVPDERRGTTVKAYVVPEAGYEDDIDPDAIRDACLSALAAYKHPREVEVRDSLPTTAIGKLKRGELSGS